MDVLTYGCCHGYVAVAMGGGADIPGSVRGRKHWKIKSEGDIYQTHDYTSKICI